jgi:D-methionine transport system permease protein
MSDLLLEPLLRATAETVVLVAASSFIAISVGLPLGVALVVWAPNGLSPCPLRYRSLGLVVNIGRSTPFIILLVALVPLTRWLVGTSIGTIGALVPLAVAATPMSARLFEVALGQVDPGTIEAARAFGASRWHIISRVLVPEALPSLVSSGTVMVVNLVGASAMAGAVGGGGLGDLGIRYGYQRFQPVVMAAVVAVLVLLVNGIQRSGDVLARRLERAS